MNPLHPTTQPRLLTPKHPRQQQETAALKEYKRRGPRCAHLKREKGGGGGGTKRRREASGRMEKGWERRGARDIGPRRRRERAGVATAEVAEVGMRCKEVGAALESWRGGRPCQRGIICPPGRGGHHRRISILFFFGLSAHP